MIGRKTKLVLLGSCICYCYVSKDQRSERKQKSKQEEEIKTTKNRGNFIVYKSFILLEHTIIRSVQGQLPENIFF